MTHTLIVPSWYPLSADDVSGCFFREQAIALQNADCQVGVIYPCLYSLRDWRRLLTGPRGLHIEADLGVPTYRCHVTNWFPRLVGMVITQLVHCGHRLFELYIQQPGMPDVLHAHGVLYAGVISRSISAKYKIPYVITERSEEHTSELQYILSLSYAGFCLKKKK